MTDQAPPVAGKDMVAVAAPLEYAQVARRRLLGGRLGRWGLRAAVLASVCVAILLGWRVYLQYEWRGQERAIIAIWAAGGRTRVTPGGPAWLEKRLGPERAYLLDRVVEVDLRSAGRRTGVKQPAGVLRHVGRLPEVEALSVSPTLVTEDDWKHLSGLTRMKRLDLTGATLSDAALAA